MSDLQLRAYAEYRGKPQKWEVHEQGYVWEVEDISFMDVWVIVSTLAVQLCKWMWQRVSWVWQNWQLVSWIWQQRKLISSYVS